MPDSNPAVMLLAAWEDCDRALAGLSPDEAITRYFDGSSLGWTLAHLTGALDTWITVRFQGRDPHPLLSQCRFRMGGSGEADDWPAIQPAAAEVRGAARDYLARLNDDELGRLVPCDGSIAPLRETGVTLRYSLARMTAHHYFHLGEIATKRSMLGHQVDDYPDLMQAVL